MEIKRPLKRTYYVKNMNIENMTKIYGGALSTSLIIKRVGERAKTIRNM